MPRPLCKICGLTTIEDVALCHELQVDFTGFIFVEKSPRYVDPETVAHFPQGVSARVGVFAGVDENEILTIQHAAQLDFLQLHGGESVDFCRTMGPERVIKVLWPENMSPRELQDTMEDFSPVCSYFLLDAGVQGGGSGKHLAWEKLHGLTPPKPWFLAGGIGAANVSEALDACLADGVDMNSALEISPGRKDHGLVRKAMQRVTAFS